MTMTVEDRKESLELKPVGDIREAHDLLSKEEEEIENELIQLLGRESGLELQLHSLASGFLQDRTYASKAVELSQVLSKAGKLAEEVSSKVKRLDMAKSRVSQCQNRVSDLMDLRLCSEGVLTTLKNEDYEQAAAHIHRFLSMDEGILKLTAEDITSDNTLNLEKSIKTLKEAHVKVKEIIIDKFEDSITSGDLPAIERFFKLFPLVKMKEEGLSRFTKYLRSKIKEASEKNRTTAKKEAEMSSTIYAEALTLLFEGIARTLEVHQPLIETYYGDGKLREVIHALQKECDDQSEKILFDFKESRHLPNVAWRIKEANKLNGKGLEKKIQPKDIEHILSELTLIQSRAEMYFKFLRKRVTMDVVESPNKEEEIRQFGEFLKKSRLCRLLQDLLSDYILLEQFFMAENIHKAMAQEEELNSDQLTSLMLDDIFYILKKTVERALSSQNVDGFCAVLNNACTLIDTDLCTMLQTQLKLGYPSRFMDLSQTFNALQTSFQQGKLQAGDSERQRILFLTYLNNAESGNEYVTRLQDSLKAKLSSSMAIKSEYEKAKIDNCLSGLPTAKDRLKSVLNQGLQQLRQSSVKPRIKPWVDNFGSHDIDEEEFDSNEANDPFIQQLIINLDGLLSSFKSSLTPSNYEAFICIVSEEVTVQLEKVVMKSSFSRLGGLQFDREVRSLVSFLTSVTTWTIRDKFARLSQIATILNIEELSEISEIWRSTTWKLSSSDLRHILNLRVDFKNEEVKGLKL
ncbi:conserved oligomeric Golgi complex subunit 4 [Lepeophtheirus salmonis]|uniref:conserved oligomeric Golgi complex subunit 4 n=1 Tax=Lepeophtheirus salmonis TaxID=72036 RepID=UPI001AE7A03A|nr:conserved oligomeric Golgi complex subunit 4-like [Lepeophtheirus salmonis]